MNINDTSLLYRYATFTRNKNQPPLTSACDVFISAGLSTFMWLIVCAAVIGIASLSTALGAFTLAKLGVHEPDALPLAYAMALLTGVTTIATPISFIILLYKLLSKLDATPLNNTLLYSYAEKFREEEDGPMTTGWDIFSGTVRATVILSTCAGTGLMILNLLGMVTAEFFVEDPFTLGFFTVAAFGTPVIAFIFVTYLLAARICKNSTVTLSK